MDRLYKVRYFASFSDSTCRSVEGTLRMVVAIKMVDDAKGPVLAPADWESSQPSPTPRLGSSSTTRRSSSRKN
jgi:alkyl hydroperoxide reductase subunit AhpC